jgi:hypothetical protein
MKPIFAILIAGAMHTPGAQGAAPPDKICVSAGQEAAFVAKWRDQGWSAADQRQGISQTMKNEGDRADWEYGARMERMINYVYYSPQYTGLDPRLVGTMVREQCESTGEAP